MATAFVKVEDISAVTDLIKGFFASSFEEKIGAHVFCGDLYSIFMNSSVQAANVPETLFTRHSKRLFLAQWPNSKYDQIKNKRCYSNVSLIQ